LFLLHALVFALESRAAALSDERPLKIAHTIARPCRAFQGRARSSDSDTDNKGETNIFMNFGGNLTVSGDCQRISSLAYFADRTPINMFSGRVRLQF
jgi:hypothetical protein